MIVKYLKKREQNTWIIGEINSLALIQVNPTLVLQFTTSEQLSAVNQLFVEQKESPQLFVS